MIHKEQGIILKSIARHHQRFTILTQTRGKIIVCVLNPHIVQRLRPGMCISFFIDESMGSVHITKNIEVNNLSLYTEPSDMYWCHHIIELCYFFAPLQQPNPELFTFLYNCLALPQFQHTFADWDTVKHLCIGATISLFDFYPPDKFTFSIIGTQRALTSSLEINSQEGLTFLKKHFRAFCSISLPELDSWLLECIQSHPCINNFKTLHFVYNPHQQTDEVPHEET
jgi:hypothetical protein